MPSAYRTTGATLPFGDLAGYHGAGMEGHFWRLTHAASGRVVIVILAISRDRGGRTWSMVSLATHPEGRVVSATVDAADTAAAGFGVGAGATLAATGDALRVRLDGAELDVGIDAPVPWPRRAFGALGPAGSVPGLSQYWHPWLLGGRARGSLVLDGVEHQLDGATIYAEKNWGPGGMPPAWWWGHADAFDDGADACVAFAGGHAGLGRIRVPAGAVVARLGGALRTVVRPPRGLRIEVGAAGWRLRGGGVEVEGEAAAAKPLLLPVPVPLERRRIDARAPQLLAGTLRLRVTRRGGLVYAGESRLAGLEQGRGA
jgi:hypothetical protein